MSANAVSGPHGRDGSAAASVPAPGRPREALSFNEILDDLNPLQYVPVVGMIYRVCTGDEGSPPLRTAASLAIGALTGGPVGFLTSLAGEVIQRVIPFEKLARSVVMSTPQAAAEPAPSSSPATVAPAPVAAADPAVAQAAMTAYGRIAEVSARLQWGGRER